jgi:hypothetical protein
MPQGDFVEYDFGGHDLRRGCRNDKSVGILLEQHALRGRIDQNRMWSAGLKRLGEGRGDALGRSREENRQQDRRGRIPEPGTKKVSDHSRCLHCAPPPGRTSTSGRGPRGNPNQSRTRRAADWSGHAFSPVIVVPRGAGTINALMASGVSIRLEALTNYGDPVTNQPRVTGQGPPLTGSGPVRMCVVPSQTYAPDFCTTEVVRSDWHDCA